MKRIWTLIKLLAWLAYALVFVLWILTMPSDKRVDSGEDQT